MRIISTLFCPALWLLLLLRLLLLPKPTHHLVAAKQLRLRLLMGVSEKSSAGRLHVSRLGKLRRLPVALRVRIPATLSLAIRVVSTHVVAAASLTAIALGLLRLLLRKSRLHI
jgi:hypothetical protein